MPVQHSAPSKPLKIKRKFQCQFVPGQYDADHDMNHTVFNNNALRRDFCFVNHDTVGCGDIEPRGLHSFNLIGLNVCGPHFSGSHMVGDYSANLSLVFEQGIQVIL